LRHAQRLPRAEHEDHDDIDEWNQRQQRYVRAVPNSPYPVQEKRTPIPAIEFRRNFSRLIERLFGHEQFPSSLPANAWARFLTYPRGSNCTSMGGRSAFASRFV
jgi:hypothetical protein